MVHSVVGLSAWLLFVENLLLGDLTNVSVGRFVPGSAASAIAGQKPDTPLLAPAIALVLLAVYATAFGSGWVTTNRRDAA